MVRLLQLQARPSLSGERASRDTLSLGGKEVNDACVLASVVPVPSLPQTGCCGGCDARARKLLAAVATAARLLGRGWV